MKVLHLISSGGMYGAEVMLLNLACAQKRLGCEPIVGVFCNTYSPHMEVADAAKARGLTVETFPCHGRIDRHTVQQIREYIRKNEIEIVHSHGWKSDIYAYFAVQKHSVLVIATCHLWTRKTLAVRAYEFLDSLVLRRISCVVAVSDTIANVLESSGIPRAKILTVSNGIDFSSLQDAFPTLRRDLNCGDKLLIGTVGRLNKQKGIEFFLQAARGVADKFPDAVFVVVGEGPERPRLEGLIRELGLQDRAFLLGERTDMPGVYASIDVFVLASIDEGMPMTVLEALAARRPVVATNVGAVRKLVISEQTGLLVEPRDVPALRNAMLRCLQDPSFAEGLRRQGQELVRNSFSSVGMARAYIDIYAKTMSSHQFCATASLEKPLTERDP